MADWGDSFDLRMFIIDEGISCDHRRDVRRVPPVVRKVHSGTRPAHGDGQAALPAGEALRGPWANAVRWSPLVRRAYARASVAPPEGLAVG